MIYCESPTLEQWLAPPQENFLRPTRTKLLAGGVMLSNSIEYATWTACPAEPIVCESCWYSGCAQVGLARIVRLMDYLIWLPPRPRDVDASWRDEMNEAAFIRDAVLIPVATWDVLRARFSNMPPAESYPRAARGDIATVWTHEMPEAVRVAELGGLEPCLRNALASDPLDLVVAREVVQRLARWVLQQPAEPVEGRLVRAKEWKRGVNTVYFDGPPFEEWPAFAVGWEIGFALGADWVFLSEEGRAEPAFAPDRGGV